MSTGHASGLHKKLFPWQEPPERQTKYGAGPETKGGGYRSGPKRWTGSGPAPARHIPWPEVRLPCNILRKEHIDSSFSDLPPSHLSYRRPLEDDRHGPQTYRRRVRQLDHDLRLHRSRKGDDERFKTCCQDLRTSLLLCCSLPCVVLSVCSGSPSQSARKSPHWLILRFNVSWILAR